MTSQNFNIEQGATFSGRFIATNSNSEVVDLSGYNARGLAKFSYACTGEELLNLSPVVDSGNLSNGYIDVILTSVETSNLPIARAYYDIEVYTSGDESVIRAVGGRINISPEVTN